jgi:4-hydroxybenzoate polyprenyltransferase
LARRLWTYQGERFPLLGHGVPLAVFSYSALCVSALLSGRAAWPGAWDGAASFISTLIFFFQLRAADEFKDYADDARYRPYRAVPRGLVSLHELAWIAVLLGGLQLAIALARHPPLALTLVAVWAYMGLMTVEFFVPGWLKQRPITYMWSHMIVIPLIAVHASGFDWMLDAGRPPPGIAWFLVTAFFSGTVFEIGRKIRAPEQEEAGVQTYSALWGIERALAAWLIAIALACLAAAMLAIRLHQLAPVGAVCAALLAAATLLLIAFRRRPTAARSKMIEQGLRVGPAAQGDRRNS